MFLSDVSLLFLRSRDEVLISERKITLVAKHDKECWRSVGEAEEELATFGQKLVEGFAPQTTAGCILIPSAPLPEETILTPSEREVRECTATSP